MISIAFHVSWLKVKVTMIFKILTRQANPSIGYKYLALYQTISTFNDPETEDF